MAQHAPAPMVPVTRPAAAADVDAHEWPAIAITMAPAIAAAPPVTHAYSSAYAHIGTTAEVASVALND